MKVIIEETYLVINFFHWTNLVIDKFAIHQIFSLGIQIIAIKKT